MLKQDDGGLRYIQVGGRDFAYLDTGRGPLALLAHCSSASHKEWLPLIAALGGRYRAIAPDLAGYGRSGRVRPGAALDPMLDVDMLLTLRRMQDGPAHLVGHSYGAAMALEAARLMRGQVRSLTLIEPPSFHLLRGGPFRREEAQVAALVGRVRAAMVQGDERGAAAAYMGFWVGPWRWWLAPKRVKASVFETMAKTALEFELLDSLALRIEDYATVSAPTRLIFGSKTPAPARAVTGVLAAALPKVEVVEVRGAGHMSPYTHTRRVNELILEHMDAHA
ncbi:MAG: alpha/beta fold hydrolase [Hyphomicrobiales bacterium]|nr:alpha/beta fold hydrolase [Hyphomicrobiales bacterium]